MILQTPLSKANNRVYKMYAGRLEKLGINTLEDFLYHLPHRYEDYSIISKINTIQPGEVVTIQGHVLDIKNQYMRGAKIKTMQKALIADETGTIELTWFNQPFLTKTILQNAAISVSGRVERFGKNVTLQTPEFEILYNGQSGIHTGRLIPVYPETKGISSKWLRRQVHNIIEANKEQLVDYLPAELIKNNNFLPLPEAIQEAHFPRNIETAEQAKTRLAFDELFLMQLAARKRRETWKEKQEGIPFDIENCKLKIENFIASLPFSLTQAQRKAVDDILHDVTKKKAMNRLLQGDVGSGKTVVAAIAMYAAHLNGYQSVLMAPTEILAEQHYATISRLLEPFGVKVDLVTGSKKTYSSSGAKRSREVKSKKASGSRLLSVARTINTNFNILVGTHAVLSEKIVFDKLALIVIDEQQRFGVEQRAIIRQKGQNPHLLTMTATPIPRTVALTMYGDLDLSYLNEMPYGRKKVKTWLVPPEKRNAAYEWIRKEIIETKSQVFIICPFIEESESMQTIKAASKEYEYLKKTVYPELKLGLLHGKLKGKEKDEVLQQFRDKTFDILVATPVVEVGIDIPNATVIMIEAADRFGLAQLHQLRGRVGRGEKQSYCLLFTESKSDQTFVRLKSMETIYSGAELAELDLKLRGPGNMYGLAQHGIPKLKVASFSDTNMIRKAKQAADAVFHSLADYPALEEKVNSFTLQNVSPD